MDAARRVVLGFEHENGQVGFGCTSDPVVYLCRVRDGTYKSRRVRADGVLRWALATADHDAGIRLRDFLHSLPADEARAVASEHSAPPATVVALAALALECATRIAAGQTVDRGLAWKLLEGQALVEVVDGAEGDVDEEQDETDVVVDCPFVPMPEPGSGRDDIELWAELETQSFELAIFDLDGTLLDTSELDGPRSSRSWNDVASRLHEVVSFPAWGLRAPHQLPAELHDAGKQVAVVTRAPERYARAVLEQFGIAPDHFVAASGSNKIAAFQRVIAAAGCAGPVDTIVFGDDHTDFEAAYALQLWSFGNPFVNPSMRYQAMPDICWWDAETLLACEAWRPGLTYLGEAVDGHEPVWHRGSLLPIGDNAWALGRYFSTRYVGAGHGRPPRHNDHPLSQAVLEQKGTSTRVRRIAEAFDAAVARMAEVTEIDVVASVPPRPGKVDRFRRYVEAVCELTDADAVGVRELKPPPTHYKQLTESERRALREGRFELADDVAGATVLLLDDVFNTGSTLDALCDAAWDAGASRVLRLAFAANQKR